jgi:hypothetical protein
MAAFLLVLFAILTRVFYASGSHGPHAWWNFTAVGGSLLFFGARRPLREAALPVLALMATDYLLTTRLYGYQFQLSSYIITWAWYVAAILIGAAMLKQRASTGRVIGASVAASTSFFLVSNFVFFYADPIALYPRTFAGMLQAYAAGVPFYRNDLISTLLVTGAAFGALAFFRDKEHAAHTAAAA